MKRRAFAIWFVVLVVAVLACRGIHAVGSACVGAVGWLAIALPRLRDIGWRWWFFLVGLAPGGTAALSVFLFFAPTGYAAQPPRHKLVAASGLALIAFGWLQVAVVFALFAPVERTAVAPLSAATPAPTSEPPARRFPPTVMVPLPTATPAAQGASTVSEEAQSYLTFAKVIYPEISDPHSPISKASAEVISEWSARASSKRVLTLPVAPLAVAIEAARRSGVKAKNFADIQTARGLPVQILAIYKRREDPRIMAFYGLNADNTAWALPPAEAVSQVQRGIRTFFSQREGQPVEIIVAQNPTGNYYLKTAADGEEPDNLLGLPNLAAP